MNKTLLKKYKKRVLIFKVGSLYEVYHLNCDQIKNVKLESDHRLSIKNDSNTINNPIEICFSIFISITILLSITSSYFILFDMYHNFIFISNIFIVLSVSIFFNILVILYFRLLFYLINYILK